MVENLTQNEHLTINNVMIINKFRPKEQVGDSYPWSDWVYGNKVHPLSVESGVVVERTWPATLLGRESGVKVEF